MNDKGINYTKHLAQVLTIHEKLTYVKLLSFVIFIGSFNSPFLNKIGDTQSFG